MADTWRAVSLAVAFASGKSMLDVANESDSVKHIKVRRAFLFNNQTAAVTGVVTTLRLTRFAQGSTAPAGGSTVTPVAHDTSNAALDAGTTCGTGRTITPTDVFRQFAWSNDEPAVGTGSWDEWECIVPFACVWDAGYADSNVQPISCRAGYGFQILHNGSSAVGTADAEIEFTNE